MLDSVSWFRKDSAGEFTPLGFQRRAVLCWLAEGCWQRGERVCGCISSRVLGFRDDRVGFCFTGNKFLGLLVQAVHGPGVIRLFSGPRLSKARRSDLVRQLLCERLQRARSILGKTMVWFFLLCRTAGGPMSDVPVGERVQCRQALEFNMLCHLFQLRFTMGIMADRFAFAPFSPKTFVELRWRCRIYS